MEEEILFDTALLEELGDKKSTIIVLGFFLDNSPKDLLELERLLSENDLKGIFNKAHKLKGSLAMLKASQLVAITEQIEIASGSEKDLEKTKTLTHLLVQKFGLLITQLKNEINLIKSSME
jgi:HPt (histidine-containing phosphotransfer) domain-containing protein